MPTTRDPAWRTSAKRCSDSALGRRAMFGLSTGNRAEHSWVRTWALGSSDGKAQPRFGAAQLHADTCARPGYTHSSAPVDTCVHVSESTFLGTGASCALCTPASPWGSTSSRGVAAPRSLGICAGRCTAASTSRLCSPARWVRHAESSNAHKFFSGIRCESLDYSPARARGAGRATRWRAPVPMPASYEDKPGVPDRIFFDLDDAAYDRQVASWTGFFALARRPAPGCGSPAPFDPDARSGSRPCGPVLAVITHLHGTELKMLRRR